MLLSTATFFLLLSSLMPATEPPCLDEAVKADLTEQELAPLQGFWQDERNPQYLLGLEGSRLVISYDGRIREVATVSRLEAGRARLCSSGRDVETVLRAAEDRLVFQDAFRNETHQLVKLPQKPPALCLSAFRLPPAAPIPEHRVAEIQRELGLRNQKDQELLRRKRQEPAGYDTPPWLVSQDGAVPATDLQREIQIASRTTENTEYLRNLVSEVGWIDAERFGFGASNAAFLLVQHSWDVPLMLAVLPRLKEDVDRGLIGRDAYALLYDRLQLALGRPQLYGSQVARDRQGVFVLPVLDPAHVEERRRQAGLIPLNEYVRVFGAEAVRFSTECQRLEP